MYCELPVLFGYSPPPPPMPPPPPPPHPPVLLYQWTNCGKVILRFVTFRECCRFLVFVSLSAVVECGRLCEGGNRLPSPEIDCLVLKNKIFSPWLSLLTVFGPFSLALSMCMFCRNLKHFAKRHQLIHSLNLARGRKRKKKERKRGYVDRTDTWFLGKESKMYLCWN